MSLPGSAPALSARSRIRREEPPSLPLARVFWLHSSLESDRGRGGTRLLPDAIQPPDRFSTPDVNLGTAFLVEEGTRPKKLSLPGRLPEEKGTQNRKLKGLSIRQACTGKHIKTHRRVARAHSSFCLSSYLSQLSSFSFQSAMPISSFTQLSIHEGEICSMCFGRIRPISRLVRRVYSDCCIRVLRCQIFGRMLIESSPVNRKVFFTCAVCGVRRHRIR
jgi:hypothetical protein